MSISVKALLSPRYLAAGVVILAVAGLSVTAQPASATAVRPVGVLIEAESYDAQHGTRIRYDATASGGSAVADIGNGDTLRYDGVDFGATRANVSGFITWREDATGPGTMELRLDSPANPPLYTANFAGDAIPCCTWIGSTERYIPGPNFGIHTVYLSFHSTSRRAFFALDSFLVIKQTSIPIP